MKAKRRIIIGVILNICVVFCFFCGAGRAKVAKILIETPLYSQMDLGSEQVLKMINQNETVEVVEEATPDGNGNSWIKIKYNNSYEGYVLSGYVYYTAKPDEYSIQVAKATGKSMTEKINIYQYYDENSEVVGTVVDGEKINVVVDDAQDYGQFTKIVYNNEYCFIKTNNITTSLTYNQRIAVYIAAALILFLIIVGVSVAVAFNKRKLNFVKKENSQEDQ